GDGDGAGGGYSHGDGNGQGDHGNHDGDGGPEGDCVSNIPLPFGKLRILGAPQSDSTSSESGEVPPTSDDAPGK
ncbi:MAG: hypothetical protein N2C14_23325, partial [Planctomycetales bacterium]